jgi:hypothetical protein
MLALGTCNNRHGHLSRMTRRLSAHMWVCQGQGDRKIGSGSARTQKAIAKLYNDATKAPWMALMEYENIVQRRLL